MRNPGQDGKPGRRVRKTGISGAVDSRLGTAQHGKDCLNGSKARIGIGRGVESKRVRSFFRRGLLGLLPLTLTIAVLYLVAKLVYDYFGQPMGELVLGLVKLVSGRTLEDLKGTWGVGWLVENSGIAGLLAGLVLIFFLGVFLATFLGNKVYAMWEGFLSRAPLVRDIYPYAKQFTGFFAAEKSPIDFKGVVLVPYPGPNLYTLGFVTGEGMRVLNEALGKTFLAVFLPTSPTPFTGYVAFVPKEDMVPVPISIEEAMRFIVSCGVLIPPQQKVDLLRTALSEGTGKGELNAG